MRSFRRICVYCGSSNSTVARYGDAARDLGHRLASRGIGVVYGGGSIGLMNAVAQGALDAGGEVIGVIPKKLQALELGRADLTELHVVQGMHARKLLMAELSDAFIALPGGYGTLEELFEATTWTQLEYHRKPIGMLNIDGFFDHLVQFLRRAIDDGFIGPLHADLIAVDPDVDALIEQLHHAEIPALHRWIDNP